MSLAVLISTVTVLGVIGASVFYKSNHKKRTETIWMILAAASFIALVIPAFWLTIGTATGQAPSFSLVPPIVLGIILAIVARRAYVVYTKKYGSNPA